MLTYILDKAEALGARLVGYQWSFSAATEALKQDIRDGVFGKAIRLRAMCLTPRSDAYYNRNRWAGRIKTDQGDWVLDSPANNACSHQLHHMFYLLGATRETSARPATVQAELYRANPIENFDTAAIRCRVETGAEVLFYTTHAMPKGAGPECRLDFEEAEITYDGVGQSPAFRARFQSGEERNYGDPNSETLEKIRHCIEAVQHGPPVACGIQAARSQTLCIDAARQSMPEIADFPKPLVMTKRDDTGGTVTYAQGLQEALMQCYEQAVLPSEMGGLTWAQAGSVIHSQAKQALDGTS